MIEKNGKQRVSFLLDSISLLVAESWVVIQFKYIRILKIENQKFPTIKYNFYLLKYYMYYVSKY